ncbi:hypothetical protein V496_02560 [Pseudogymnoascus sp. VKM F-4515 (FW-2607)]|nr:hypothetical protein V496_02560 [Pseudogymnoascus sp. VKM F-4515 (FW-2607)]
MYSLSMAREMSPECASPLALQLATFACGNVLRAVSALITTRLRYGDGERRAATTMADDLYIAADERACDAYRAGLQAKKGERAEPTRRYTPYKSSSGPGLRTGSPVLSFLKLMQRLRIVLLQDLAALQLRYPPLAFFAYAPFYGPA